MLDFTSTSDFASVGQSPLHASWFVAQDGSSTGMFGGTPTQGGTTATPGGPPGPAPTGTGPAGGGSNMLFLFMLPLLFLVLLSMWMNRKEKKKRETLLSSVGKHDVVLTVGGIIGTVAEIHDDKIVLRVDDSNKTKIAFAKSSVQQVIRSANAPAADPAIETKGKAEKAPA